eukprot:gene5789-6982_t
MGKYKEEEMYAAHLLEGHERKGDDSNPELCDCLYSLAAACEERGDYRQALAYLVRASQIEEANLGPNHALSAANLSCRARVLVELGRYAEVQQAYQRAIQVYGSLGGAMQPDIVCCLDGLATALVHMGRDEETGQCQVIRDEETGQCQIQEELLGTTHSTTEATRAHVSVLRESYSGDADTPDTDDEADEAIEENGEMEAGHESMDEEAQAAAAPSPETSLMSPPSPRVFRRDPESQAGDTADLQEDDFPDPHLFQRCSSVDSYLPRRPSSSMSAVEATHLLPSITESRHLSNSHITDEALGPDVKNSSRTTPQREAGTGSRLELHPLALAMKSPDAPDAAHGHAFATTPPADAQHIRPEIPHEAYSHRHALGQPCEDSAVDLAAHKLHRKDTNHPVFKICLLIIFKIICTVNENDPFESTDFQRMYNLRTCT